MNTHAPQSIQCVEELKRLSLVSNRLLVQEIVDRFYQLFKIL